VDIKGTNSRYPPLVLDHGPPSLRIVGSAARSYIFLAPAIRGEVIRLNGAEYRAEGDRRDGWDGGAEDALSLLHAAETLEPRIQSSRVCAFGRSRGAGVALLAAERDSTIACVAAVAAPVDWFDAMWRGNWPPAPVLARALGGLTSRAFTPGQFVEWFVSPFSGQPGEVHSARRRMLASSAAYYAERLPRSLVFFGDEDTAVPIANAERFMKLLPSSQRKVEIRVAKDAGHDTDPIEIAREVPAFFSRQLRVAIGRGFPGADAR
jgi:dipeptidyl aminopeptidase/acylaminoacyl peptidase